MASLVATLSEIQLKGQTFTPRWGLSAVYLAGKVYIFGGYLWFHGVEGFFHDLYELDINSSTVRRLVPESSSIPAPRFGHTLVADPQRNELILFGGRNSVESFCDIWSFDIMKQTWTQLNCPELTKTENASPKPQSGPPSSPSIPNSSTASIADDTNSSRKNEKRTSRRDRDASKSDSLLMVGPQSRSWHTSTLFRNAVYVYGGWDHHNRVFNDLWSFDLSSHSWSRIDPPDAMCKPPHGRSCHHAAVWNDHLYIFGGLRDGDAAIGDMWKFSFEARGWTPVECSGTKPVGRTSAAGVVVNDSWIIHGGLTDYPRTGMCAIPDVLEFHFPSNSWIHRAVMFSDNASSAGRRYGHVAVVTPHSSAVTLLGGAEKYATASSAAACRIDLLPSQSQVTEIQGDLVTTTRIAQMNRERVSELVEVVQSYEAQIRLLKSENSTMSERAQAMQSQMAALHQQHSALQASFQNVQSALAAVEQFIPMMRGVGAAIANFGNAASQSWAAPGSAASLGRVTNSNQAAGTLQSTGDLR